MHTKIASNAQAIRRWLVRCQETIGNHSDRLNAINIFPVADADTGTNMYITLGAANAVLQRRPELMDSGDLGIVLEASARAAMEEACGNSGTLLSVFFAALAEPLRGAQRLNAPLLAAALQRAQIRSWSALSEPLPGTMLSVLQAAAEGAANADAALGADESNHALSVSLDSIVEAALQAVIATEAQLDELRQAEVVDAGGVGLLLILDCLRAEILQRPPREDLLAKLTGYDSGPGQLAGLGRSESGAEVMCTIVLTPLDAANLRMRLNELGDSVIMSPVSPDVEAAKRYRWRIHVHVRQAEAELVLSAIRSLAEPLSIQVTKLRLTEPRKHDDD